MTLETVRELCISLKGVTECFPFNEDTLVFKVMDKMFVLMSLEKRRLSVKSDPENAIRQREAYAWVYPAYHMSKTHWNMIDLDGRENDRLVREWILDSYHLVVASLPRKLQAELGKL